MIIVAIGRVAQFILLLLTLRLATTFLSPAEMGKVSIITATVAFFALLFLNPVGMFMNRRLHAWDAKGLVRSNLEYFWRYLLLINLISALTIIGLTQLNVWSPSMSLGWLLFLVCGNLAFGTLNQVVIPGLNLLGHRAWFTILTVATASTSLICALLLVYVEPPSAEYWSLGLLAGQLIVGLLGLTIFFSKIKQVNIISSIPIKLSSSHYKNILHFSWPIAIAVGLGWIQNQGYRYFMETHLGLTELGLFVAGYGISAGLISGFDSIFVTYFQPKFYKQISLDNIQQQSEAWIEYAQAILPALLLTSVFIMATAPELTQLLLGTAYKSSSQFVIWGAIAELARVSTGVFSLVAQARMNTKLLLWPNLMGAILSITLIWFLAPDYGSSGVGFGLTFAAIITLLLSVQITKSNLKITLPYKFFLKSILAGGGLLLAAEVLRWELSGNGSLFLAVVRLSVIGLCFLVFQYIMLIPVLRREAALTQP
ncbi:MAG: polysaccharide biosynthesis C-terminal domain-containing protein [Gallionellaceae bacterium]|jgi:O-antigen/teichoic acid export membrane protein